MNEYGLLIDYEYCTGCHSCEMACRQGHDFGVDQWGIKVAAEKPYKIDDTRFEFKFIPTPTQLCDMCTDRIEAGKDPYCVHHCQAKCMYYGTLEELAAKTAELRDAERNAKTVMFFSYTGNEDKPVSFGDTSSLAAVAKRPKELDDKFIREDGDAAAGMAELLGNLGILANEFEAYNHQKGVEFLNDAVAQGMNRDEICAALGCKVGDLTRWGYIYTEGEGFKSLSWSNSDMTKSYFSMDE